MGPVVAPFFVSVRSNLRGLQLSIFIKKQPQKYNIQVNKNLTKPSFNISHDASNYK